MPFLYMLSGPNAGDTFEVKDGTTLVGRGPDNDLQIVEQSVSRKHARFLLSGGSPSSLRTWEARTAPSSTATPSAPTPG